MSSERIRNKRKRYKKRIGQVNARTKRARINHLIIKYRGICQNCGILTNREDYEPLPNGQRRIGPTYPTIEHIIPHREKPKLNSLNNLTLFCYLCNNSAY